MARRDIGVSQIGINPYIEFTDRFKKFCEIPGKILEADYSRFDKSVIKIMRVAFARCVARLTKHPDLTERQVTNLFMSEAESVCHAITLCEGLMYQVRRSVLSGEFITSMLDDYANLVNTVYCVIRHFKEKLLIGKPTYRQVEESFRALTLGDDNFAKFAVDITFEFWQETSEELGLTLTPADKDGFGTGSTFLSRRMEWDNVDKMVYPALKKPSITRLLFHFFDNTVDAYVSNFTTALYEAALWDREFFEHVYSDIKIQLKELPLHYQTETMARMNFPDYDTVRLQWKKYIKYRDEIPSISSLGTVLEKDNNFDIESEPSIKIKSNIKSKDLNNTTKHKRDNMCDPISWVKEFRDKHPSLTYGDTTNCTGVPPNLEWHCSLVGSYPDIGEFQFIGLGRQKQDARKSAYQKLKETLQTLPEGGVTANMGPGPDGFDKPRESDFESHAAQQQWLEELKNRGKLSYSANINTLETTVSGWYNNIPYCFTFKDHPSKSITSELFKKIQSMADPVPGKGRSWYVSAVHELRSNFPRSFSFEEKAMSTGPDHNPTWSYIIEFLGHGRIGTTRHTFCEEGGSKHEAKKKAFAFLYYLATNHLETHFGQTFTLPIDAGPEPASSINDLPKSFGGLSIAGSSTSKSVTPNSPELAFNYEELLYGEKAKQRDLALEEKLYRKYWSIAVEHMAVHQASLRLAERIYFGNRTQTFSLGSCCEFKEITPGAFMFNVRGFPPLDVSKVEKWRPNYVDIDVIGPYIITKVKANMDSRVASGEPAPVVATQSAPAGMPQAAGGAAPPMVIPTLQGAPGAIEKPNDPGTFASSDMSAQTVVDLGPSAIPDLSGFNTATRTFAEMCTIPLDTGTPIIINGAVAPGTIVARLPYGILHQYANPYARLYCKLHRRFLGRVIVEFDMMAVPVMVGSIMIGWVRNMPPENVETMEICDLQMYAWKEMQVSGVHNERMIISDARDDLFFRSVYDEPTNVNDAEDRPGLVIVVLHQFDNQFPQGTTQVSIRIRAYLDPETFRVFEPISYREFPTGFKTPLKGPGCGTLSFKTPTRQPRGRTLREIFPHITRMFMALDGVTYPAGNNKDESVRGQRYQTVPYSSIQRDWATTKKPCWAVTGTGDKKNVFFMYTMDSNPYAPIANKGIRDLWFQTNGWAYSGEAGCFYGYPMNDEDLIPYVDTKIWEHIYAEHCYTWVDHKGVNHIIISARPEPQTFLDISAFAEIKNLDTNELVGGFPQVFIPLGMGELMYTGNGRTHGPGYYIASFTPEVPRATTKQNVWSTHCPDTIIVNYFRELALEMKAPYIAFQLVDPLTKFLAATVHVNTSQAVYPMGTLTIKAEPVEGNHFVYPETVEDFEIGEVFVPQGFQIQTTNVSRWLKRYGDDVAQRFSHMSITANMEMAVGAAAQAGAGALAGIGQGLGNYFAQKQQMALLNATTEQQKEIIKARYEAMLRARQTTALSNRLVGVAGTTTVPNSVASARGLNPNARAFSALAPNPERDPRNIDILAQVANNQQQNNTGN
jgi:hypothetical protein